MRVYIRYKQNGNDEYWAAKYSVDPEGFYHLSVDCNPFEKVLVKCCNNRCSGVYDLRSQVDKFIKSGENHASGYVICNGRMDLGKKRTGTCINSLYYEFSLESDTRQNVSESER